MSCPVLSASLREDTAIINDKFFFVVQDKVILETTDHITEFTSKFKALASALRAAKMEEFRLNEEKRDLRLRLQELTQETKELKGKCQCWAPDSVQISVIPLHRGKPHILF